MRSFLLIAPVLAATSPLWSQGYTITASGGSGLPGSPVSSTISIGHPQAARAFSFGLLYDSGVAALVSVDPGPAVTATNGGSGPDYFFSELDPVGGPGGYTACVVSLDAPIGEIPAHPANAVAVYSFEILPGATPGASSSLDFSGALGDPTVPVVISVVGVSHVPTETSGSIAVLTPPVEDLVCTLSDLCGCEFLLTWTNPAAYEEIQIFEEENLIMTLTGGQTSFTHNLAGPGIANLGVMGVGLNRVNSALTTCAADCRDPVRPASPEDLSCSIDVGLCEATLTWTNPDPYNAIEVHLDGQLDQTLTGDATMAVVEVPADVIADICLKGNGLCDLPFTEVCCSVACSACQPVTNLSCVPVGDNVQLSWNNGDTYTLVRVFRNSLLIATLLGTSTSFIDPDVPPGAFTYAIEADCGGGEVSPLPTCEVVVPCQPVLNLQCSLTGNDAQLTWTNEDDYTLVRIRRNSLLIATLLGTSTSFVDPDLPPGDYNYEVEGNCGGGQVATPVTCDVTSPPLFCEGVTNSACVSAGDDVVLSWANGDDYSLIRLFREAVLIATLPGSATSFTDPGVPGGNYTYSIQGECSGGDLTPTVRCQLIHDPQPFLRGDCDGDMVFNGLLDALYALNFQFIPNSPEPLCLEACEADGDAAFNGLLDALYVLGCQFVLGSPCPSAPYPDCGPDSDPATSLGCGPNACP